MTRMTISRSSAIGLLGGAVAPELRGLDAPDQPHRPFRRLLVGTARLLIQRVRLGVGAESHDLAAEPERLPRRRERVEPERLANLAQLPRQRHRATVLKGV